MTLAYYSSKRIEGLSSDTKPTTAQDDSVFFETDTGKFFDFDLSSTTWTERSSGGGSVGNPVMAIDEAHANYTYPSVAVTSSDSGTIVVSNVGSCHYGDPDLVTAIDGSWSSYSRCNDKGGGGFYQLYDFGVNASRNVRMAGSCRELIGGNTSTIHLETSENGSSWTTQYSLSAVLAQNDVGYDENFNVTCRYARKRIQGSGGSSRNWSQFKEVGHSLLSKESHLYDGLTTTGFISNQETNPYCYIDMGSSVRLSGVSLYASSSNTETEIAIQTSDDALTWTTVRTITTSNLTDNQWNYIRFNSKMARYLRIYGNSGNSLVLAIILLKAKQQTDTDFLDNHTHAEISTTDTSIGLDGT